MGILFKLRGKWGIPLGSGAVFGFSSTRNQSWRHEFTTRLKGVVMKSLVAHACVVLQHPGAFSTDSHNC